MSLSAVLQGYFYEEGVIEMRGFPVISASFENLEEESSCVCKGLVY